MFRWVIAAVATIVILLVVGSVGDKAETDAELSARVADRLADEGLGWVETEVTGRKVTIVGAAATEDERAKAVRTISAMPGVAGVVDQTEVLPAASPYQFVVTVDGDAVVAQGSLPSSSVVETIKSELSAAFGDNVTATDVKAASGAPENFRLAVETALSAAELLSKGKATVDDTTISVEGTAKDEPAYDALTGGGTITAPEGYVVKADAVSPSAAESGTGGLAN